MVSRRQFEIALHAILIASFIMTLISHTVMLVQEYDQTDQVLRASFAPELVVRDQPPAELEPTPKPPQPPTRDLTPAEYIGEIAGFHPSWHPLKRSERFPSITERLKMYMGNWYLPPCNGERLNDGIETIDERISYRYDYSDSSRFPTVVLTRSSNDKNGNDVMGQEDRFLTEALQHDTVFAMWENNLWSSNGTEICPPKEQLKKNYCADMRQLIQLALQLKENDGKTLSQLPPVLGMFGDLYNSALQIPSFQNARHATTRHGLEYITSKETGLNCTKGQQQGISENGLESPRKYLMLPDHHDLVPKTENSGIIWPFNYDHHFRTALFEEVRKFDIPWESKKNVAVWRGALTGTSQLREDQQKTFTTFCASVPRCCLVDNHRNSSILDLGFIPNESFKDKYHISDDFFKLRMERRDQCKYKAIIIIEGNDVATGLKWALYSRSVVLMPTPRRMSYAMEEWLEPWTHYIPISIHRDEVNGNGSPVSDVEEKMQWVLDHDEEARKIAERGTLFMHDLLFDPDHSQEENRNLKEMILERYFNFFVSQ